MIIFTFNKNVIAKIEDNGKIIYWPGVSDVNRGWALVGLSRSRYEGYAYSRAEMLANKITEEGEGNLYPVLCDDCGNFAIHGEKIKSIRYGENQ